MNVNLVLAFGFACGVFLMVTALRLPATWGKRLVARADEDGARLVSVAEASILASLLADLSQRISPQREALPELLRRSGWVYASPAEYHFRRMVAAILFTLAALLLSLAVRMVFALSFPVAAGLVSLAAVAGFFQPDWVLAAALRRRRTRLLREMGFGLERIALFLASGADIADALGQCQSLGLFGQAALRLSVALKTQEPSAEAVAEVRAGLPEVGAFTEFLELVRTSQVKGQNLVEPFQSTAEQLRQHLQLDLIQAGNQAKTKLVVITAGVILVASLIVILAPMLLVLAGSGLF